MASNNNNGENKVEKLKYSLSGVLISRILDVKKDNLLIRNRGTELIFIENNKVVKTLSTIKFKPIAKYTVKDQSWLPNTNIGVIDIETYLKKDGLYAIYALGFKTNLDPKPITYYIDSSFNSSILVLTMIK